MRRILVVDDDLHISRYARGSNTMTLLRVIDECPSEAEPHRRHAATLGAVASALSGSQDGTIRSNELREGVLTG